MHRLRWEGPFSRGAAEPRRINADESQDEVTGAIVDAALRIHIELGPGLMESVYEAVLARALEQKGFPVERQNSGAPTFREGLKRMVNGFQPSAAPRLRANKVVEERS